MKLRQALKIYNRVDTPRRRQWKESTVSAALRRYQKTDTSKDVDAYWDYLMRLRRRQLAAEPDEDEDWCKECGTPIGNGNCGGCNAVASLLPDDNYDESDGDGDEDYWDEALDECGMLPPHLGGGCTLAGTEHCDFECPFRDHPELLTGEDQEAIDAINCEQPDIYGNPTDDKSYYRQHDDVL